LEAFLTGGKESQSEYLLAYIAVLAEEVEEPRKRQSGSREIPVSRWSEDSEMLDVRCDGGDNLLCSCFRESAMPAISETLGRTASVAKNNDSLVLLNDFKFR
jgi:hypothetical protein